MDGNLNNTSPQSQAQVFKKSDSQLPLVLGIMIGVLIFVVAIFVGLNYFNVLSISKIFPEQLGWLPQVNQVEKSTQIAQQEAPVSETTANSSDSDILPIDPRRADVYGVEIFYSANVVLNRIEFSDKGTYVHSSLSSDKTLLPPFLIIPETKIVKAAGESRVDGTPDDLREGQNVTLRLQYDIKTKQWTLRQIYIVQGN